MSNFDVSAWILQQAKIKFETFECEGNDFDLLSLTDDLIELAREFKDPEGFLEFCATYGLAAGKIRAVEVPGMTEEKLAAVWLQESIAIDVDPSVCHQVGRKVVEISDLEDFLDKLENTVIDGDNLDEDLTVKDLTAHANEYEQNQVTNA